MTREDIMNMPAGREMDKYISRLIFGREEDKYREGMYVDGVYSKYIQLFSNELSAAFEIVEKLGDRGWMLYKIGHTLSNDGSGRITGYTCIFLNIESGASREVSEVSLPKAISKCALLTTIQGEET